MMKATASVLALLATTGLCGTSLKDPPPPPVVHVAWDSQCVANCHGQTWDTAYNDLSLALHDYIDEHGSIFYIKEGTYKPTNSSADSPRHASFEPPYHAILFGGFVGTEHKPTDRVKPYPPTYLDGNIGDINDATDNVYHVVYPPERSTYDGLIIVNGYADGPTDNLGSGGGVYIDDIYNGAPVATFKDCSFINNTATQGAGVYIFGVNFTMHVNASFDGCLFQGNYAPSGAYKGGTGAGFHVSFGAQVNISNTIFKDNEAELRGGAVYQDYGSNITFTNVQFLSNSVTGGHGGGFFGEDRNSQFGSTCAWFHNCTFKSNSASAFGGGAMWFKSFSGVATNSRFISNKASLGGALTVYDALNPDYLQNEYVNNQAAADSTTNDVYSDTFPIPTNVSYGLYSESEYLQILWDTAQNDNFSIDGLRETERIERKLPSDNTVMYCNVANTDGSHDGKSWATAFDSLQDALDECAVLVPCEIWIAAGKYVPSRVPSFSRTQNPPDMSLILYSDIELYGGFDGTETTRDDRDWNAHPTYIWGGGQFQQLMVSVPALTGIRIDGLIFKRGHASQLPPPPSSDNLDNLKAHSGIDQIVGARDRARGSALYINSSVVDVVNTLFIENYGGKGGAVYCMGFHGMNDNRSPTFTNVAWVNNVASFRGGALAADVNCSYTCDKCLFVGNTGVDKGGQVYNDFFCNPTLINSTFRNGYVGEAGGAYNADGGGHYNLTNVVFDNNTVNISEGGALYVGSSKPLPEMQSMILTDVKFNGNKATYGHTDMFAWENEGITVKNTEKKQSSAMDVAAASLTRNLLSNGVSMFGGSSDHSASLHTLSLVFGVVSVLVGVLGCLGFVYWIVRKKA